MARCHAFEQVYSARVRDPVSEVDDLYYSVIIVGPAHDTLTCRRWVMQKAPPNKSSPSVRRSFANY
jgi:hypothetical protein